MSAKGSTGPEPPLLVVVTGPVGGGKSTLGQALADHLRRESAAKVAVIDLDVVYCMLRQKAGFGEAELWPLARRACRALADCCFEDEFQDVVLEGEYFSQQDFDALRSSELDSHPMVAFVVNVSYAEALRRVGLDPSRGASKDPVFLSRLHQDFVDALPFLRRTATVLDAEYADPNSLAAEVASLLAAIAR